MYRQTNSSANTVPIASDHGTMLRAVRSAMPRRLIQPARTIAAPSERSPACHSGEMPVTPTLTAICPSAQIAQSSTIVAVAPAPIGRGTTVPALVRVR